MTKQPLAFAALLSLASLLTPGTALAFPADLSAMPSNRQSLGCPTCHVTSGGGGACTGGGPCLNPFGTQYRLNGFSYAAIRNLDADGDGQSNDFELTPTATLPGFPNGPDAAGCDMGVCAQMRFDDCGSAGVRCSATVSATGDYSFAFSCDHAGYSFTGPPTLDLGGASIAEAPCPPDFGR